MNKMYNVVLLCQNNTMFRFPHLVNMCNNVIRTPYDKELTRLTNNPIINNRILEAIKGELNEFNINQRIAFGRSLEIFEIFKKTHYVFHHGQPGKLFLPLNFLIKSMVSFQENKFPLSNTNKILSLHETFIRHPIQVKNITRDVKFYVDNIRKGYIRRHNDHIYTKELLSVDAHLTSTAIAESALCIFLSKSNSRSNLRDIGINEISSLSNNKEKFLEEFIIFENNICKEQWNGILYTICVEKNYFPQCGYLSLPFGISYPDEYKLKYYNMVNDTDILDKLQNTIEHTNEYATPQVRLLTHKLDPQYVKIFIFPAITDDKYLFFLNQINDIVYKYFILN